MAKKIVGIYKITCTKNGKRYIGQSNDIKRRFNQHKTNEENSYLRADMEKFGLDDFIFEILEECAVEELTAREDFYLDTLKPEYNIKAAGNRLPEESIEKLRKAKLGQKFTPEHCQNISKGKSGKKIAALSIKVQCVETGEIFPSITAAADSCGAKPGNISKVLAGKRDSAGGYSWRYCDETINQEKADEIRKQRQTARFNKKPSENFSKANRQAVQCVETGKIFDSIKKAADSCNVTGSSISAVLNKSSKTAGGFHWIYIGEKKRNYQTFPKAVHCIETGETFENIKSAAKKFNIYPETICRVLQGRQKTAGGFHFEYVDKTTQGKFHREGKAVRCVETGVVYASVREVAEAFGVTVSAIGNAAKDKCKKSCGYHWEFCTA